MWLHFLAASLPDKGQKMHLGERFDWALITATMRRRLLPCVNQYID
jgi:hypothetical protein